MAALQRPVRSPDNGGLAVPTVAKLSRLRRCAGTVQTTVRRRRCLIYADTALDGRPLCRRHLAQALLPPAVHPADDGRDVTAALDVLRQVLGVLRVGIPDPVSNDRLLAVVPTSLVARIEDALQRRGPA